MTWRYLVRITLYTVFLLLLQSFLVSHFFRPELRIDPLLVSMFGTAFVWSPLVSVVWASVWGFIVDALSGKFWGFHVGSYVVAVCLVNMTAERFEYRNPFYQMLFVGACALGQSGVLGLFLLFDASGPADLATMFLSLLMRSMVMMVLAPLITYPLWNTRGDNL